MIYTHTSFAGRMQDAEACFLIASRNYTDKTAAVSIIPTTFIIIIIIIIIVIISIQRKFIFFRQRKTCCGDSQSRDIWYPSNHRTQKLQEYVIASGAIKPLKQSDICSTEQFWSVTKRTCIPLSGCRQF